jgi:hypothetical protein
MSNNPPQQDGSRRHTRDGDGDDQEVRPIPGRKGKDTDPKSTPLQDKVDPINLFSSVFFSGMNNFMPRDSARDKDKKQAGSNISTRQASVDIPASILRKVQDEIHQRKVQQDEAIKQRDGNKQETGDETETSKAAGPSFKIDDYIPQDRVELRETKLYQSTHELLQWQRDHYLVGFEYANWRKKQRPKYPDRVIEVPYDKSALGHAQIAGLAAWFIPTDTVRQALLPIVVLGYLPDQVLFPIARDASLSLIASQQANLDLIIKRSLISLLKNERNREAIKNSTQGYIAATTYRDSEQESNSNGNDQDSDDV